jgi:hypothetical protein
MRNASRFQIFFVVMGLAIIGCSGPAADSRPAPAAREAASPCAEQAPAARCAPPLRQCVRCDGSGTFCAPRCPECAPPLTPAPDSDVTSLTCRFPLHDCLTCTGGHVCARLCPLCPPAASDAPAADALSLAPPRCG